MNTSQDRYAEYLQTDHWKRVSDAIFQTARLELNDIIELVTP